MSRGRGDARGRCGTLARWHFISVSPTGCAARLDDEARPYYNSARDSPPSLHATVLFSLVLSTSASNHLTTVISPSLTYPTVTSKHSPLYLVLVFRRHFECGALVQKTKSKKSESHVRVCVFKPNIIKRICWMCVLTISPFTSPFWKVKPTGYRAFIACWVHFGHPYFCVLFLYFYLSPN